MEYELDFGVRSPSAIPIAVTADVPAASSLSMSPVLGLGVGGGGSTAPGQMGNLQLLENHGVEVLSSELCGLSPFALEACA